jgi:hypothetical protein
MNCAQHTDTEAVSYCCNCGKALCAVCKREVQGAIFCEPCLAARIRGQSGASPRAPEDTSPELALFLGFIPGVGAFYNGQFLKGFVHVIVLCMLIFLSDHGMRALSGLMIAAWFFYMVFDAYTTAKARRYGLPIPDPIGLNAILEEHDGTFGQRLEQAGQRIGANVEQAAQHIGQHWRQSGEATPGGTAASPVAEPGNAAPNAYPSATPSASPPPPDSAPNTASGATSHAEAKSTYYSGPEGTYYAPPGYIPPKPERSPVGAVLLIAAGVLFLLSNLGWFSFSWIDRYWPVILIAAGLWLFIRRRRSTR